MLEHMASIARNGLQQGYKVFKRMEFGLMSKADSRLFQVRNLFDKLGLEAKFSRQFGILLQQFAVLIILNREAAMQEPGHPLELTIDFPASRNGEYLIDG